jgi:hypothetical protein
MPWDAQAEYLAGLKGVYWDDAAHERLTQLILSHGQAPDAASTCRRYGLSGSGEGKLSMPFRIIETVFPARCRHPHRIEAIASPIRLATRY